MVLFNGKLFQRAGLLTLAFILAISSMSAAVPLFLSRKVFAAPNTAYTPVSFGGLLLVPDRQEPSGDYVAGNDLTQTIDNAKANTSSTFYQTEGLQGTIPPSVSIKARLFIDTAWAGKSVRAGLWGITKSDNASDFSYPVIEYTSVADGGFIGFRVFNTMNGGWTNLDGVTAAAGNSYLLEIAYNALTSNYDFYVNNSVVLSKTAMDGNNVYNKFSGVIFNNYNFATRNIADNYSVKWSNFSRGTAELAAATNLRFQFQYDAAPLTSNYLNITAKPGNNNLELLWNAPAGIVNGYHIYETFPDKANTIAYQGPNTNAWLNLNAFGQHGQGAYTYQIAAVDSLGYEGALSTIATLYYDTIAPVVSVTPLAGSYLHGMETFHIAVADANLNPALLKNIYVYLYNNNPPQVSQGANIDLSSGSGNFTVDTTKLANGLATLDVQRLFDAVGNASGMGDNYFTNYQIDNTTPNAPTGLYFQAYSTALTNLFTNSTTNNQILLNWTDPTNSPSGIIQHITEVDGPNGYSQQFWNGYPNTWLDKNGGMFGQKGDGAYTYKVKVENAAGTWSSWSSPIILTYDTLAPVVTFDPLTTTTNNTPTITGTVVGDTTATLAMTIDGTPTSVAPVNGGHGTWSYAQASPLSDGVHVINVTATDEAGNVGRVAKTTLQIAAPVVTVIGLAASIIPTSALTTTPTSNNLVAADTQAATDNLGTSEVLGTQTKSNTTATDTAATPEVKGASKQADQASGWALAWYWWVLIVAAAVSFIWWLIARRRNLSEA